MSEGRATHDVVDALVVVGSIATVLTLLDESFWSRDYLVAGLVPAVFLVALALITRRLDEGVWFYSLAALVAYAPMGALAALVEPGPWIVPTFDSMAQVLGESVTAPRLFVSTLPPVEASGTLMLLPYAIGFLSAMPAAWLALAGSRPVAPVVPLLGCLAATIPVAVLVPDHYVLRAAVIIVVLLSWAGARARRGERLAGQRRSGLAATVAGVATVACVAALVSIAVPDDDQTDRARLEPAGGEGVAAGASASLPLPMDNGEGELLRATGVPDGHRIRFGVLDLYDGAVWTAADESPGAGPAGSFRPLGARVSPINDGARAEVRFRIRPGYASAWLPLVGELTSLDLDYRDGRTQLGDVRYNQATWSAVVDGGVDPRDDYTITAVLPPDGFTASDEAMVPKGDQVQPEGEFLDTFLEPFDRADLAPLQRVLLLSRYLRQNGAVRLSGSSSQAPIDLGLRLLGAQDIVATPFQYTAATALAASRLGVPARVVVGARPGPRGLVRQRDVFSWVELQLSDGGWRTLEPDRYTGTRQARRDEEREAAAVVGAAGWVDGVLRRGSPPVKIPKGADIDLPPGTVIEEAAEPWRVVGWVLVGLLGLAVLTLLLVPLAKAVRRGRRRRSPTATGVYVDGWQEVLDAARDRGTPVPESWGRLAQAHRIGAGAELARRADAAVFAPGRPDDDADDFWQRCQELRGELLASADRRHRWWSAFNPASLVAGWARRRSDVSGSQLRHEDRGAGRQQAAGA